MNLKQVTKEKIAATKRGRLAFASRRINRRLIVTANGFAKRLATETERRQDEDDEFDAMLARHELERGYESALAHGYAGDL